MASLAELVRRPPASPWQGAGIPWSEPGFSERMLREHLAQHHDLASRRAEIIDAHVAWTHEELLAEKPSRVLDLACGPGLYTDRLARLGHECSGIDFSPASIGYANEHAQAGCAYRCEDIRGADYGDGFDLVMLIFGELNTLRPDDAAAVLRKSHDALSPGGRLLLEAHTAESVRAAGSRPASWYSSESGLFSDRPHVLLQERLWHASENAATIRYHVIDATTSAVVSHLETRSSYSDEQYKRLLGEAGFSDVAMLDSLPGTPEAAAGEMAVYIATRETADE